MLDPDDGLLAVDGDPHKAVLAALARLGPGFELITHLLRRGRDLGEAEELAQPIQAAAPGVEGVEVLHGGQPHYQYLISAE